MQSHGTSSVLDRLDGGRVSPLITGPVWFEAQGRPHTLRMAYPLSVEVMVAALYFGAVENDDIAATEDVWGQIAITVTEVGMARLEDVAAALAAGKAPGPGRGQYDVMDAGQAGWLATCRRRVSEVLGGVA